MAAGTVASDNNPLLKIPHGSAPSPQMQLIITDTTVQMRNWNTIAAETQNTFVMWPSNSYNSPAVYKQLVDLKNGNDQFEYGTLAYGQSLHTCCQFIAH